jgi:hypothetical protein
MGKTWIDKKPFVIVSLSYNRLEWVHVVMACSTCGQSAQLVVVDPHCPPNVANELHQHSCHIAIKLWIAL